MPLCIYRDDAPQLLEWQPMTKAQLDMFETQADLRPSEPVVYRADPDKVRVKLERTLAEARSADSMPWDWEKQRLYQTIFPQMTRWLPDEEAAQFRLEFQNQLERLS
jgi:hypothetical protein